MISTLQKPWSVKKQVHLAILTLALPLIVLYIWFYQHVKQETYHNIDETLAFIAHNTAMQSVDRQIKDIKNSAIALAIQASPSESRMFIDSDESNLKKIVAYAINANRHFTNILVWIDGAGFNSIPKIESPSYDPKERPWFPRDTLKNNWVRFSMPYSDEFTHHNVLTISKNLNDDQGVRYGALSMDLDLAAMSLPLKEIALPLNGKLAVVHHSGQIVMHANPQEITLPIAHPEWLKQMTDAEGYFYDENSGIHVYYHSFTNPDWHLILTVEENKIEALIAESTQPMLILAIVTVMLYITVAVLWNTSLQRMLSELLATIRSGSMDEKTFDLASVYSEIKKQHRARAEANKAAIEDSLTGLFNRRYFDERLPSLIENRVPFFLAMIDIDNFKQINDRFGHPVGDEVLKYIGKVGQEIAGPQGLLCRYGGEELVMLILNSDTSSVVHLLDKWRIAVDQKQWHEAGLHVTFSGGLTQWQGETAEEILKIADDYLYTAKHNGKNNIVTKA